MDIDIDGWMLKVKLFSCCKIHNAGSCNVIKQNILLVAIFEQPVFLIQCFVFFFIKRNVNLKVCHTNFFLKNLKKLEGILHVCLWVLL